MYERILVPLDGSALAEGVIPYVKQLAKGSNSRVTALYVAEPKEELRTDRPRPMGEAVGWGGLDVDSATELLQLLSPLHDVCHIETHPVMSFEDLGAFFQGSL